MSRFSNGAATSHGNGHAHGRCYPQPGDWVSVTPYGHDRPNALAVVAAAAELAEAKGSRTSELVTLHDGTMRETSEVAPFDMAAHLALATAMLASLRVLRPVPETHILRVHRAACLARGVCCLTSDAASQVASLVHLDEAIAATEMAGRHALRVRLPNLARSIYLAGALELARSASAQGWMPGEGKPHPNWPRGPRF